MLHQLVWAFADIRKFSHIPDLNARIFVIINLIIFKGSTTFVIKVDTNLQEFTAIQNGIRVEYRHFLILFNPNLVTPTYYFYLAKEKFRLAFLVKVALKACLVKSYYTAVS